MKIRTIAILGALVLFAASSVTLAAPAANSVGATTNVEQQSQFQNRLTQWFSRLAEWMPGMGGGFGNGTCDQLCDGTGDCDCEGDGDPDRKQDRIHQPGSGAGDGEMKGKRTGDGTGTCISS